MFGAPDIHRENSPNYEYRQYDINYNIHLISKIELKSWQYNDKCQIEN